MANYTVNIKTQDTTGAGTDSEIFLTMVGETGKSTGEIHLNGLISGNAFERNDTNTITIDRDGLGRIVQVSLRSDGSGPGSDWDIERITISNPDGYNSAFEYQTTITGDEGQAVTRDDGQYPWPVNLGDLTESLDFERRLVVEENATNASNGFTLKATISGERQVEISKETVKGNTVSIGLTYQSPQTAYGSLKAEGKAQWTNTVDAKKIQKDTDSYSFEQQKDFTQAPNSLNAYEMLWAIPKFQGPITEDNRTYIIQGLSSTPTLGVSAFETTLDSETKIPYKFKSFLKASGDTQKLQKWAAHFQNPPALVFDGANTYASANEVCTKITNSIYSFSCWANPSQSTSNDQTLLAFNTAIGENCNMIGFDATKMQFFYFDPDNNGYIYTNGSFSFDVWYHIHCEVNIGENLDGLMKLYINGNEVISRSTSTRLDNKGRFSIGQEWDAEETSDFFKGLIADVRVWNRGLSNEELLENYKNRLSGDETELVLYYPMDEESGNTLFDQSVSRINAEVIGGAEWEAETTLPIDQVDQVLSSEPA